MTKTNNKMVKNKVTNIKMKTEYIIKLILKKKLILLYITYKNNRLY